MSKILIIAEKPAAGRDIAKILDVTEDKGGAYMESDRYIVTWAVGHLVELKDPEDTNPNYKYWNIDDIPLPTDNGLKIKESGKKQFGVIKSLIAREDIEYLINAGDAGREGLLIQTWIYRMAANRHPVKLLWASSLTPEAIKTAMSNLHDDSEKEFVNLLREAETRAIADQVLGYNYTRLLTCLYAEKGTTLSYGRCQTPLLNLIAKRDLEYDNFKPEPYWTLSAEYAEGFKGNEIDDEGKAVRYTAKEEALKANTQCGTIKSARIISCVRMRKSNRAPELFNLAELQGVMGKKYGYTPDKTLETAQSLYEKHKIMSYPRTDSRFLSTDLYGEIESHVQSCNFGKFKQYIDKINFSDFTMSKSYFNDNKVSDHHALIPTINGDICNIYDRLTEAERNCFDEVAASLISIFYPEYVYETTEITASIGGKKFKSSGTTVINNGYKEVQKLLKETAENGNDEDNIPELQEGEELNVASVGVNENKTKPPARYNPGNIIKLMGKYKIGTAATSAGIIQSLITRKFIKIDNGKYTSTELGRNFLGYVPAVLKSPNMTIEFEERLQKVNTGDVSQESFINGLTDEITRNKNYFLDHLPEERLNVRQPLGKCPLCGGNMRDGKKGWYCENYAGSPKCGFSVWKEISGKKIPETEAKKIFEKGKSGLINGFVSKKTGKKFSAYLVIEDDRVVFSFPDKK